MTNTHESVGERCAHASTRLPILPGIRVPGRLLSGLAAGLAAAVLAGCSTPHPAPIVHREPVPPARTTTPTPIVVPPVVVAPEPAPIDGPIVTPVETARGGGPVESRPLAGGDSGARPLSPVAPVIAGGAIRTEPSAAKQPYSDATLARLRQSAPQPADGDRAQARPEPLKPAPLKPESARTVSSSGAPSAQGFIWPASGPVLQGFSEPRSMGVTIGGQPGDPVVAAADGRVIFSGAGPRAYGNLLIVKHGDDTLSVYAHNRALLVKEGTNVKRGQRIAELGATGTDRPKLHFEIRRNGKPVDPAGYLPSR